MKKQLLLMPICLLLCISFAFAQPVFPVSSHVLTISAAPMQAAIGEYVRFTVSGPGIQADSKIAWQVRGPLSEKNPGTETFTSNASAPLQKQFLKAGAYRITAALGNDTATLEIQVTSTASGNATKIKTELKAKKNDGGTPDGKVPFSVIFTVSATFPEHPENASFILDYGDGSIPEVKRNPIISGLNHSEIFFQLHFSGNSHQYILLIFSL